MFNRLNLSKKSKQIFALNFSVLMGLTATSLLPSQANESKLKMPTNMVKRTAAPVYDCTPDILLIMPNVNGDSDEVDKLLKEAKGTIVGSMGQGKLKCIIYKTEKGHMLETEKKFMQDKEHFNCISRNYRCKAAIVPNDPNFPSEWHLGAINAPTAWDTTMGNSTKIAIFDSGCQASNEDLGGKIQRGYNATTFGADLTNIFGSNPLGDLLGDLGGDLSSGAQTDVQGHGTLVATTAAATANNHYDSCGVAPGATVYPVQIADSSGSASDISIMAGMLNMPGSGNKIINISYANPTSAALNYTNASVHAPLHAYFRDFHDNHNGLIFIAAGNLSQYDPNPAVPYLNIVSAIAPNLSLTTFSNWGAPITFTAPGQNIVCSSRNGTVSSVAGTSFATPIVASIAALIWTVNPRLPNTTVINMLKASCSQAGTSVWNQFYGYGMPDAARAVQLARGVFRS